MIEDEGMTKINGIGCKVMDREDGFDSLFTLVINTFTEGDRGFGEIRSLTRGIAERLKDEIDLVGLISSCFPANNQVVSKKESMNARTIRSQGVIP